MGRGLGTGMSMLGFCGRSNGGGTCDVGDRVGRLPAMLPLALWELCRGDGAGRWLSSRQAVELFFGQNIRPSLIDMSR